MVSYNKKHSEETLAVIKQYLQFKRLITGFFIGFIFILFTIIYFTLSPLFGIVFGMAILITGRLPIFQAENTVHLQYDEKLEKVVKDFTGPEPPILAIYWGIADKIDVSENRIEYEIEFLFGLVTTEIIIQTEVTTMQTGDQRIKFEIQENGQHWSTYVVTISRKRDSTIVNVDYSTEHRFGFRRLPQSFVSERYIDKLLTAQGYTLLDHNSN